MNTFKNILGQDSAVGWLRQAYAAGRLPHGMIFAGPVGVGKATTAAALAALWLCENPKATEPCGKCDSCRVIAAGNHPDFVVITKELIRKYDRTGESKAVEFSIDVIRPELLERAGRTAVMNRGKVFVIERAELLTPAAKNAMLKTLEEPSDRTLIILLADQPGSLLATIRSRCQIVRFSPLTEQIVSAELVKRGIGKSDAAAAAKLSGGSLGEAMLWIDDGVIAAAGELMERLDGLIAGRGLDGLSDWLRKSADAYGEKQLTRDPLASKPQATRDGLALYLRLAADQFRRILESDDDASRMEKAATAIDAIVRAEQYLDSYVNTPLVLQQLSAAFAEAFRSQQSGFRENASAF